MYVRTARIQLSLSNMAQGSGNTFGDDYSRREQPGLITVR